MKLKLKKIFFISSILFSKIILVNNSFIPSFPSFDASMNRYYQYNPQWTIDSIHWNIVKKNYEKYVINLSGYQAEVRIPKIIHRIWVGSPQPEREKYFEMTWLQHHPTWQYKLWTDGEINKFGLVNKRLYDATNNMGKKADIARYEILNRFGGLYIDTDFECLHSFDILHYLCDFYTGIAYDGPDCNFLNGLIAAKPEHPILKTCINELANSAISTDSIQNILKSTGPYFFTQCVYKHLNGPEINIALPVTFFYPWPNFNRFENQPAQIKKWIMPESFAVHHWHVSWQK